MANSDWRARVGVLTDGVLPHGLDLVVGILVEVVGERSWEGDWGPATSILFAVTEIFVREGHDGSGTEC